MSCLWNVFFLDEEVSSTQNSFSYFHHKKRSPSRFLQYSYPLIQLINSQRPIPAISFSIKSQSQVKFKIQSKSVWVIKILQSIKLSGRELQNLETLTSSESFIQEYFPQQQQQQQKVFVEDSTACMHIRSEMIFMCKIILMECLIINDMNINIYMHNILVALKVVIAVFGAVTRHTKRERGFWMAAKLF